MAIDPQFVECFNQRIHVAEPTGLKNDAGDKSYSDPVARLVRVEEERRLDYDARGKEKMTSHRIYTDAPIGTNARIWLVGVDEFNSKLARMPMRVDALPDEDGTIHHYEVVI